MGEESGLTMTVQKFDSMLGAVIEAIVGGEVSSDDMRMRARDGRTFRFSHLQDCCEHVRIEEIHGDVADLIGHPLVEAEEVSSEGVPYDGGESGTWTFYKFSTVRGSVTVRWLGESNGYYSESVDFEEIKE
jgi:hypothetical protein